jgi:tetratricopeptide (TPR) repeat protein
MSLAYHARPPASSAAAAAAAARPARRAVLAAAGLFLATVLLYLPSFGHDFIRGYDDDQYVLQNGVVLNGLTLDGVGWAFTTTYFTNWLPLTWLSHMLDVSLFGLNPVGHHATGIVLHAANAGLLLLALHRLTGRLGPSAAAAVLFAVHPLRVESVSWVAERKDVLSGAFFMAVLLAYAWYAERPTGRRYAVVAVLHGLGLMAKTMLVTLPFVLLLLDWWPLRRLSAGSVLPPPADDDAAEPVARPPVTVRRLLLEKVPLLTLSALASAWTMVFQAEGGAMGFGATLSLGDRLSTAIIGVPRYLASMVWPTDLAVLYPHPGHWPLWQVAAAAGFVAVVTAACWLARRRTPYLLVGWLWFLGMLLPVSGVVQVGFQSMADRYTYLPGIGITLAVAWLAADVLRRRGAGIGDLPAATATPAAGRPPRWAGPALSGVAAVALGVATVRQQAYWADSFTLFNRALAVTEGNWMAHSHVGTGYYERGDDAAALDHFRQSLAINPGYANGHFNIGNVMAKRGNLDEALAEYREAIRVEPKHELAYYELGRAYLDLKRMPGEAVDPLTKATELRPAWAEAQSLLARALAASGRSSEAVARLKAAAGGADDGGAADAQYNLGDALARAGKPAEAAAAYRNAIRLDPAHAKAHFSLGAALAMQRQPAAAVPEFAEAVKLRPDWADARASLGRALAEVGRFDDAERELAEAVRLNPQHARAQQMLAQLRSRPR